MKRGLILLAAAAAAALAFTANAEPVEVDMLIQSRIDVLGSGISYPEGTPEATVSIVSIEPGAETGWHYHEVPLIGYILQGQVTVDYGDRGTKVYSQGEALVEAMNWPHKGMNLGEETVKILAVYAGADGIPNSVTVEAE